VVTPAEILRATQIEDIEVRAHLDIWFDPDKTTIEGLKTLLTQAGFEVLHGDGEVLRIRAPEGIGWEYALIRLPEVRRVSSSVQTSTLPSGRTREGKAVFQENMVYSFSWGEGGPKSSLTGVKPLPPAPLFPAGAAPQLIRCLSPVREAMLDGISSGPGWERAIRPGSPPAWVMVLEDYGACKAEGFLVLNSGASTSNLTIDGQSLESLTDSSWWSLAASYLAQARAEEDRAAMAAFDLMRVAPDEVLGPMIDQVASEFFQLKLYDAFEARSPQAALAAASVARSPALIARAAAQSLELRTRYLNDPAVSTRVLAAILSSWRPGPSDDPAILERFKSSADPVVRRLAWERSLDMTMKACVKRVETLDPKAVEALQALYQECPQQPVRSPAFQALAALDREKAGILVAATLQQPETTLTGIAAARHAAALGRADLLEAVIARETVAREVRRVALELLVKSGQPAEALVEKYGAWLGYRPSTMVPPTAGN
jgi:hypothetical protein